MKYRIIKRLDSFIPQYRGWFGWRGNVRYENQEAAQYQITRWLEGDRYAKAKPKVVWGPR